MSKLQLIINPCKCILPIADIKIASLRSFLYFILLYYLSWKQSILKGTARLICKRYLRLLRKHIRRSIVIISYQPFQIFAFIQD